MDIILIPGLWLDASSWGEVTPPLVAAGHRVRPVTLPGTGQPASVSAEITIDDWVDAVIREVDESDGDVVLVGHSGGGNVAWGAAATRHERVARVVFVDTVPPPPGGQISEFPVVNGVIPFPGWDFFDDDDVADLDASIRASTAPLTRSVPALVPTGEISLTDPLRTRVPVTVLSGGMDEEAFRAAIANWGPYANEFEAIDDSEVVRLGSGHWPQFSMPARLAAVIDEVVTRER